ncbi:MAG: aminomethyl-transferring glycine dehydrogenase subunit GcvPB [Candidatus Omnitrophica bacterium]|nr:aminomethyl-transferring glycine dehydrogenase subunit GcvPB [Candidatus Omnitrophota bacterium]MDD5660283.1 aminomethyl-transferring glycine dehydrogenase subunit GcvPB [Candidatus Omnitrophota bacterium]
MKLIFEKHKDGRRGFSYGSNCVLEAKLLPRKYCRAKAAILPSLSELDVVRHYTNLSRLNFSVDTNFYPLGSCTMKYNPKFTEKVASFEGFLQLHPLLPQLSGGGKLAQGSLEVLYETEKLLCEITAMSAFTMQPLAGAHGELTGVMLIAAYHKDKGSRRKYVIVPDSSHGTNPASAAIAGYQVKVIPTGPDGYMDLAEFKKELSDEVAAVMLTCPDTLGIFNPRIKEITDLAHKAGALMYYDGANLNAMLGKCRPGDIGFDVVHLNLHKTFATPHGGGGPGAGPVGVSEKLAEFLPISRVVKRSDGSYALDYNYHKSIGYIAPFYGNFGVILKAYAYMLILGKEGLTKVAEIAVLNANYCQAKLKDWYDLPFSKNCMHECVFSAARQVKYGVHAIDIAKYLIDKGFHPPTIYFPLIVSEALMIEPTETESKETIDAFIDTMIEIARLAKENPSLIKQAPLNMPVKRLDEVRAARDPDLSWKPKI